MGLVPYFPEAIQNWDVSILNFIQENWTSPFWDKFFSIITKLGDGGIFWIAVAVVFVIFKRTRKTGLMMGMALILGVIFCNLILKNVIGRVRPYELEGAMRTAEQLLISQPGDKSFPSGHTIACFESAGVLMIRDKRFGIPALIIAILVAFSRLYLYVHFPTDVLTSVVLGTVNAILGVLIVGAIWKAVENKIAQKKLMK